MRVSTKRTKRLGMVSISGMTGENMRAGGIMASNTALASTKTPLKTR